MTYSNATVMVLIMSLGWLMMMGVVRRRKRSGGLVLLCGCAQGKRGSGGLVDAGRDRVPPPGVVW